MIAASQGRGLIRTNRWFLGKTIGLYLFTFWIVLTLNFLIPRLLPGDPLLTLLNPDSSNFVYDEEQREQIAAYYGLDKPMLAQYLNYLGNLAHGNMGNSIFLQEPVVELIGTHLPRTLLLMIPSLLLASLIVTTNAVAGLLTEPGGVARWGHRPQPRGLVVTSDQSIVGNTWRAGFEGRGWTVA